jgi:hypothetical protein
MVVNTPETPEEHVEDVKRVADLFRRIPGVIDVTLGAHIK